VEWERLGSSADFEDHGKAGRKNLCSAKADAHNEVTQRSNLADDSQTNYMETRKLTRDHLKPGTFFRPHGACLDEAGDFTSLNG
jgi:hypothetical protein